VSDGGLTTATVGGFTVTSNSGISEAQLERDLKPKSDDAASRAGSELGKRGGKAAAEKRAAEKSDLKAEQTEPDEKPEPVEAKAEPDEKPEAKAEEPEKPPEEKKGDPRHDPKARMLEATRKEAEAKRALAAEREARAAVEARLEALERSAPRDEPGRGRPRDLPDTVKPTPDGFDSYEEYLDARDAYNRKAWEAESIRLRQAEQVDRAIGEQKRKFAEVTVPNLEKYSEEVLSLQTEFQIPEGAKPTGSNWIANELFFSPESAPTLMLHLTEHPEELQRIAALISPRAVSREMAKIEARLEAATTATSPEREDVSRAAPPVRPVTGKPYVTESDEWKPGMNLDDYSRIWNKQKRNR
jgi:hypothetical protein